MLDDRIEFINAKIDDTYRLLDIAMDGESYDMARYYRDEIDELKDSIEEIQEELEERSFVD